MRRKRCDRIHETNEQQQRMVWVEVYVFDEEWVVAVYDMCDQEWLSEDVCHVLIGSNRQFIQLQVGGGTYVFITKS